MPFECLPECGKCCGKVNFSPDHYERVKHRGSRMAQIDVLNIDGQAVYLPYDPIDGRCSFLDRKTMGCLIHDDKPQICKDFGLSEHPLLACPYVDPSGKRRSRQARRRVMRESENDMLRILGAEG